MAFDLTKDISTLLTSINANVFGNEMPTAPDDVIVIYNTGGYDPIHSFRTAKPSIENPTFQVVVRSSSGDTAQNTIESIKNALDGASSLTINTHTYLEIFQMGDVQYLGRDDNRRHKLALNFKCKVRR